MTNFLVKYSPDQMRDPNGKFASGGGITRAGGKIKANAALLKRAREIGDQQIKDAPVPSMDKVKQGEERARLRRETGIHVRRTGSPADRRVRATKLLNIYGNGTTAPCLHCGTMVTRDTMNQDRIYGEKQGGGYSIENLFPSCGPCNQGRGDAGMEGAVSTVQPGAWGSQKSVNA